MVHHRIQTAKSPSMGTLMLLVGLLGCAPAPDTALSARRPGERAPLTAACDPADALRCLLPWPSSTYTVADPDTETGLRLAVESTGLLAEDDVSLLNRADGFSRVSSVMTAFSGRLDADRAAGAIWLLNAQPDHPDYGVAVPVRV